MSIVNIILLLAVVVILALASVINKIYNNDNDEKGIYAITAVRTFSAMLVFVVVALAASPDGKLHFTPEILWYSVGFAVAFGTCLVCNLLAIRYGSLSLSTLIISYSLLIPTVYGLLFLGEPMKKELLYGIFFLAVSLFMIHYKKEGKGFSLKWIIFVLLSFIGNGMCSTVQRMQQITFNNQFSYEFMIVALGILTMFLLGFGLGAAPKTSVKTIKKGWFWGAVYGVTNGLLNYFVMLLNKNQMPASVMFPIISGGSILLVVAVSRIFFKERLSKLQLAGVGVGIVSLVLFNL